MTLASIDEYGPSFQMKVISSLLTHKEFLQNINDVLSDEYFSNPAHKWIINEIIKYYEKYHTTISMDILKVEMKKLGNPILKVSVKEQLREAYKADIEDLEYVQGEFSTFCKNQQLKKALLNSVDLLKAGDYDSIKYMIESAMKAAQRLMIKYNIDQKDIELTSNDINKTIIKSTWVDRVETRSFELRLLLLLSSMFTTRVIKDRNKATNTDSYILIGMKDDRQAVESMYNSILPQIRTITHKRFLESTRELSEFRFTSAYQTGFIDGMREKMTADKVTLFKKGGKKDFDLMVVKKDAVIDEWVEKHLSIKSAKIKGVSIDKESYDKGKEDGSDKNLNKQLGSKGKE